MSNLASLELSRGTKRNLNQMTEEDASVDSAVPGLDTDELGWFDDDFQVPLDSELQISGEGGETEHLAEYLGK
jgi:hypothetical protein